jgi:hypothetical protein
LCLSGIRVSSGIYEKRKGIGKVFKRVNLVIVMELKVDTERKEDRRKVKENQLMRVLILVKKLLIRYWMGWIRII